MTALIYFLHPDYIILATDSLATTEDSSPIRFVTKIMPLPHIKSVICGTGSFELIIDWFSFIQKHIIAKDIHLIDKLAPEYIRNIYYSYPKENQINSTIYQFGYDIKEMKFVGYAYRSTDNFNSEKLIYGIGIKPPDVMEDAELILWKENDIYKKIINLIIKQKEIENKKDSKDKVGIGGAIYIFQMVNNYNFFCETYIFDDFESTYNEMLNTIKNSGGILL